jgi:UDP-N-acetylglucosamine 2-epimerase (hydrolysing)
MCKRVVFLTGTRADFGKVKSLMTILDESPDFEVFVFATGMHMEPRYGYTVREIEKCGFSNIYRYINKASEGIMDRSLANTIHGFGDYIRLIQPDLIVVHGDRCEALAGAMVGSLNNIVVAHIEGGELSGSVDELIRHAVSKMSHLHFVSNHRAKQRLMQMGEDPGSIFAIGSPDLDILASPNLPSLDFVKSHYEIPFERFGILVFHPVTTRLEDLHKDASEVVEGVLASKKPMVAIYPNNDQGSNIIFEEYERRLVDAEHVRLFPSLRFEYILVLLQYADFVVGNSSMGIHEAPFYGTPTINVGCRQQDRTKNPHILHVPAEAAAISGAIEQLYGVRHEPSTEFGEGDSDRRFLEVLSGEAVWKTGIQKRFRDAPVLAKLGKPQLMRSLI